MGQAARARGVVARGYVPDAGDLVWLTFDPQAGHEQRGRRPALILSPRAYNAKARLAIACPVTSHARGIPSRLRCRTTARSRVSFSLTTWRTRIGTLDDWSSPGRRPWKFSPMSESGFECYSDSDVPTRNSARWPHGTQLPASVYREGTPSPAHVTVSQPGPQSAATRTIRVWILSSAAGPVQSLAGVVLYYSSRIPTVPSSSPVLVRSTA